MVIGLLYTSYGHQLWATYIIKYSTYIGWGKLMETGMMSYYNGDISEVTCGARNDKSLEAVA